MADEIHTKDYAIEGKQRPRHEAGVFVAQCVDVINLGKVPETYKGEDKGLVPKGSLVFRSGEMDAEGKCIDLAVELSLMTGAKARLRQWAEAWRGKKYDEEYPDIPVHKFEGLWATITVTHKTNPATQKTYANITGLTGLPKGTPAPATDYLPGYTRAPWWEKRKAEYKAKAEEYLAKKTGAPAPAKSAPQPVPPAPDFDEPLPEYTGDDSDDLPF
jgi:hypothetical protein